MSLDNSPEIPSKLKTLEVDTLKYQYCRRGAPVPYSCGINPSFTQNRKPSFPMPFIPRPFPPPALVDVPLEYIVDQLHNLAPQYWNRPETADCTISEAVAFCIL